MTNRIERTEGLKNSDLTICTNVIPLDKRHIELNLELTDKLNSKNDWQWIVTVDNNETEGRDVKEITELGDERCSLVDVYDETIAQASKWGANYHHGAALNKILDRIKTRYVLFIDPDFYIVRNEWISEILEHMKKEDLAFFGVPWHPKWYMKFRNFPCIHCLFIDLEKIPLDTLNLLPDVPGQISPKVSRFDGTKKKIRENLPGFVLSFLEFTRWSVRNRKLICKEWDTGSRIFLRYGNDEQFRYECPTPVFNPPEDFIGPKGNFYSFNTFIEKFLPEKLSYIPKDTQTYTLSGFKDAGYSHLTPMAWEEFMWKDAPFGFHVRRYPKRHDHQEEVERQDDFLPKVLNEFVQSYGGNFTHVGVVKGN